MPKFNELGYEFLCHEPYYPDQAYSEYFPLLNWKK